jgi:hypothetical protein
MQKKQNVYKVYALIDPRNGHPFYIGATCVPLEQRLMLHISTNHKTKYCGNLQKKYERLRSIIEGGKRPIIKTLRICDLERVDHYESFYYRKFVKKGYKLLQHNRHFNYRAATEKSRVPGYGESVSRSYKARQKMRIEYNKKHLK